MSQENVEIVRRMHEAFDRGDADGALAFFDPEVVADHSARFGGAIGHGREELRRIISEWVGAFSEFRAEIVEIRDLGGGLVLLLTAHRGRGRGSGVEVTDRFAVLYEMRDATITRMTLFLTTDEALQAAGLSE
jgi:ketosteroid isomerase-like protein